MPRRRRRRRSSGSRGLQGQRMSWAQPYRRPVTALISPVPARRRSSYGPVTPQPGGQFMERPPSR
jgi:hypothetical protein